MFIFTDAFVEHRDEPVPITEENILKFKISDLVLPLPGYDVRYPENETEKWYLELLRLNSMEGFTFKHKSPVWISSNIHHSLSFIRCHNCCHKIVNRMHELWCCLFEIYECLTQQINLGLFVWNLSSLFSCEADVFDMAE